MNTDRCRCAGVVPSRVFRPILLVISAPSGAGKTTLCKRLMAETTGMVYSVSCTTRQPRVGEKDGLDYHFLSHEEFEIKIKKGLFLEYAVVHSYYYGTLKDAVVSALSAGKDVLMDIDVQGARQIRDYVSGSPDSDVIKRAFVDVFVAAPSMDELRKRLMRRGQDSADVIEQRLKNAAPEIHDWRKYQYLVVNDRLDEAVADLKSVIRAEHCRIAGNKAR